MASSKSNDVILAERILEGQTVKIEEILVAEDRARGSGGEEYAEVLYRLAMRLKKKGEFGYARKVLSWARRTSVTDPTLRSKLRKEQALCTYKDPLLPLEGRLDRGLEVLGEEEDLGSTRNPETLGLAGAIYKRKWEVDGQKQNLEQSLAFYLRGYEEGPENDNGYTGINAAYVLDLLASVEQEGSKRGDPAGSDAERRREMSRAIRERIINALTRMLPDEKGEGLWRDWWLLATLAEAHFGLREYGKAAEWLERAKGLNPDLWQLESTVTQLGNIVHLHEEAEARAARTDAEANLPRAEEGWKVLGALLGGSEVGLRRARLGKVGLALTGGGFRASLFHLGVLAKLAELDVLRNVEVLSCVSGGAIIGAHYYLEVGRLLRSKPDAEITREDYIEIVQRLERDFLAGVQKNIRMRGAANFLANFRAIFRRSYSRSERIGELLERHIFSRVQDGGGGGPRFMDDLHIHPPAPDGAAMRDFSPLRDNWRRSAKVPDLVLNATSLNTGHNWQFTASSMGESSASINAELDTNARLLHVEYGQASGPHRRVRLGHAVAASASLPGLLEPIVLDGLYDGFTVRLADGGLHDSQGVAALLEQNCTVMIICDGGGYAVTQEQPGSGIFETPFRATGILRAHLRAEQYERMRDRRGSRALRGLMYLHLRKSLEGEAVGPACADDKPASVYAVRTTDLLTPYGIRRDVQASLAAIRTDLDTFSDVEAYALMVSGYRMAEYESPRALRGFPLAEGPRPDWRFLSLEEAMKRVGSVRAISGTLNLLGVASNRGFKVWRLSRAAQFVGLLLGLAALSALYFLTRGWWEQQLTFRVYYLVAVTVAVCLALLALKIILVTRKLSKTLTEIGFEVGLALFGWLAANLYLGLLDRIYLKLGRVTRRETPSVRPERTLEADGGFVSNVRSVIQHTGRPIKAVARALDQSDPTTHRFVDRSALVEAFGKLFEAVGDKVYRFPRSPELNPLQINLDLVVQHQDRLICAEVKTPSERSPAVDWTAAAELQTASWFLSRAARKPESESGGMDAQPASPREDVRALLVLVDAPPGTSLDAFRKEGVKVVTYKSYEVGEILNKANQVIESVKEKKISPEQARQEVQPMLDRLLK